MAKVIFILLILLTVPTSMLILYPSFTSIDVSPIEVVTLKRPSPKPNVVLQSPPVAKTLSNDYHVFQTFNNCGPASLSMALSYFNIIVSQTDLGNELRPYQNSQGDNDDKSVTLEELGRKASEYGFITYHRPAGNPQLIKQFIAYDMPIITRTWTKPDEDIGHYRVIKGYDDHLSEFIQDDSLQGKNLHFSYEYFDSLWKAFNYEYLVLVPPDKNLIAQTILGQDTDDQFSWNKAAEISLTQLSRNPNDIYARFNLVVAYYHTGQYQKSVAEFEKIEANLPFRTLWYQIEPILAYYKLGDFTRVFEITNKILNNHNRAFSELYILRGRIYQSQNNFELAEQEFENAKLYNRNLDLNMTF